jgi:hypothetical protein
MEICIKIAGKWHCFFIPILRWPIVWPPGPGPQNYPAMIKDAVILGSIREAAKDLSQTVRQAVDGGITAGFEAFQRHAGADVKINEKSTGKPG